MRPISYLAIALAAVLACAAALLAADGARGLALFAELGRGRPTKVSAEEARFLRSFPEDVTLTYYVSEPERMPSEMRPMARRAGEVLGALVEASEGRLELRILHPDGDAALERFAAARGAAPFQRRSVVADQFRETTVWSTLEIAAGARAPVLLRSLGPDQLPHLRALVLAHLECLLDPPEPVVAFDAPPGFDGLAAMFEQVARVVRLDLDAGERPPADADLVVWIEPRNTNRELLLDLEAFREDGGSLWIAGSEYRAEVALDPGGQPALRLAPRGLDAAALWAPFGLRPLGRVVLDERAQRVTLADGDYDLPFLVRSIGQNQDFRGFVDQPAGSLLFAAPTALQLDGEALAERRLSARVLATTSDLTVTRDLVPGTEAEPAEFPLAELRRDAPGARPLAKQPLAVLVEPDDTWQGALVAMGSASALHDANLDDPLYAHNRFAQIVAIELLSNARLVARRTELPRPTRLEPLDAGARLALRLAVLLALPGLLLALAFGRGEARFLGNLPLLAKRAGLGVAALLALVASGGGFAAIGERIGWDGDLSEGALNELSPTTVDLGRSLLERGSLEMVWYGSPLVDLAPEQRAGARRALALFERFARETAATLRRIDPASLGAAGALEFERTGIAPFQVRSQDGERSVVRAVHATLRVSQGERHEDLAFPDALSFEDAEFRLAHALWRLVEGRRARIALATDAPRLSPAEAQAEYQSRQRFAPSGTDVYSLARGALERADFEVVHVSPTTAQMPSEPDALIWLQPRRSIGRMMDALVRHLHGGGRALVAAQHFVVQPQQHEGSAFRKVYWPQPQVPDLETTYLPDLGITLAREVLFDERSADVPLVSKIGSDPAQKDYDEQTSALPFVVRTGPAPRESRPLLRGIGEQVLPFANAWALDERRLAEAGLRAEPLLTTSERTWSYAWNGGFLPEDLLESPPLDDSGAPKFDGVRPLALAVTGTFPMPVEPLFERVEGETTPPAPSSAPGELLLIGGSELFKNTRLLDPRFRADRLLVNAAAHLALPADLAALAGRRSVPPALGLVDDDARIQWRAAVLAGGPMVALLALVLRFARRRFALGRMQP